MTLAVPGGAMTIGRNFIRSKIASFGSRLAQSLGIQVAIFNAIRLNRVEIAPMLQDKNVQFLSYCLARRTSSRAQIIQDLWVCFELQEKRAGYFVEFGATDGRKNSNTWLLEKKYQWRGILAEPNSIWHESLSQNRTAHIEHDCVSSRSGDVVVFITTNDTDPELSAIAAFSDGDHFGSLRDNSARVEKSTISLDDLLDKYGAPDDVDYLSMDTEGSELDILSAYSFRRKFKLISVEQNQKTEAKIQALLEAQGYVRVFSQFSQWDGWYVLAQLRNEVPSEMAVPDA